MENSVNGKEGEKGHKDGIHLISWDWDKNKSQWIFCFYLLIAAITKIGYHYSNFLRNYIPESCILIILGLGFGAGVKIILESAYSLHDRDFLFNIGTILLYAVIGTFINISLIGPSLYLIQIMNIKWMAFPDISFLEVMIFGTAISAVDPVSVLAIFQDLSVNKPLYFLVFGESLLNDAVVIVVGRILASMLGKDTIESMEFVKGFFALFLVSVGGFLIGITFGVITSLITLKTEHVRVIEPMIIVTMAYIAFLTAEIVHFSGIISIIGCGLIQAEYAFKNISRTSRTTAVYFTKTLSTVSDLLIFFFLGTMLINESPIWNTSFVLFSLIFCMVYRFVSVFILTFIANYMFQRVPSIKFEEQVLMAYGGLRGAVAFALIAILNNEPGIKNFGLLRTTTLIVILFTVFILGGTTKPLLNFLRIRRDVKEDAKLFHLLNNKFLEDVVYGVSNITGVHTMNHFWVQKLVNINEKYIKKILTHGKKSHSIQDVIQAVIFKDEMEKVWGIRRKLSHQVIEEEKEDNKKETHDSLSNESRIDLDSTNSNLQNDYKIKSKTTLGSMFGNVAKYLRGLTIFKQLHGLKTKISSSNVKNNSDINSKNIIDTKNMNNILQNAFDESTIELNILRRSVSKGQIINRQLIKDKRTLPVKDLSKRQNSSGSSLTQRHPIKRNAQTIDKKDFDISDEIDVNDHYKQNLIRRLSLVSNLEIIEDVYNDHK